MMEVCYDGSMLWWKYAMMEVCYDESIFWLNNIIIYWILLNTEKMNIWYLKTCLYTHKSFFKV